MGSGNNKCVALPGYRATVDLQPVLLVSARNKYKRWIRFPCLPTQGTRVRSLGQEDPLEKEVATHSSVHGWEIPWTEEPGRLQSMGSQTKQTITIVKSNTIDNMVISSSFCFKEQKTHSPSSNYVGLHFLPQRGSNCGVFVKTVSAEKQLKTSTRLAHRGKVLMCGLFRLYFNCAVSI